LAPGVEGQSDPRRQSIGGRSLRPAGLRASIDKWMPHGYPFPNCHGPGTWMAGTSPGHDGQKPISSPSWPGLSRPSTSSCRRDPGRSAPGRRGRKVPRSRAIIAGRSAGQSHRTFLPVMAVPGHDPGISSAIHVVLQERSRQVRSAVGRDSATPRSATATWMAGTSLGHDGEGNGLFSPSWPGSSWPSTSSCRSDPGRFAPRSGAIRRRPALRPPHGWPGLRPAMTGKESAPDHRRSEMTGTESAPDRMRSSRAFTVAIA
jgi:hypothetical protein